MKTIIRLILFTFIALSVINADAATYYVRTDGGTGTQCTGTIDAAYPGSGTGQACAFNHPHWVIPLESNSTVSESSVNNNGDMIIIKSGSYRMGCQDEIDCVDANVNTKVGDCNTSASYDCDPRPLSNNVTIVGCSPSGCGCTYGWGGQVTCTTERPELWGAGNVQEVLDVSGSSGVTIKDIEITDHANCNSFLVHSCRTAEGMNAPLGLAGQFGINATGATNLTLTGVNNHGMGYEAMRVKNVNGLTVTGSNFDYAVIGMNNDDTGDCTTCGFSGAITFNKSSANFNGCIEDWENDGVIVNESCCSQDQGCSSADGLGFSDTGGIWEFNDSDISHNTSDGLDLLYVNKGIYSGSTVTIKRSRFEGNAGNQVKVPNDTNIQASKIISNCGYFYRKPGSKTLYEKNNSGRTGSGCNYDGICSASENSTDCQWVDSNSNGGVDVGEGDCPLFNNCRAQGNALVFSFKNNNVPVVIGNTIIGNSDVLIQTGGSCTAGTDVIVKNNILVGGREFLNDTSINPFGDNDSTSIYYNADVCDADFVDANNLCFGFKEGTNSCNGSGSNDSTGTSANTFSGTILLGPQSSLGYYRADNFGDQISLKTASTAIDMADSTVSGAYSSDFNQYLRTGTWDAGALEFGSTQSGGGSTNVTTTFGGVRIILGGGKISQ